MIAAEYGQFELRPFRRTVVDARQRLRLQIRRQLSYFPSQRLKKAKPGFFSTIWKELRPTIIESTKLLSQAATIALVNKILGKRARYVRIAPQKPLPAAQAKIQGQEPQIIIRETKGFKITPAMAFTIGGVGLALLALLIARR